MVWYLLGGVAEMAKRESHLPLRRKANILRVYYCCLTVAIPLAGWIPFFVSLMGRFGLSLLMLKTTLLMIYIFVRAKKELVDETVDQTSSILNNGG